MPKNFFRRPRTAQELRENAALGVGGEIRVRARKRHHPTTDMPRKASRSWKSYRGNQYK